MKPYYDDGRGIVIYHGDCREVLPALEDGDAAIVDPPYNQTSLDWDRWVDGWPDLLRCRSMWCFGTLRMFMDRASEFAGWKMSQDLVWEKHNGSSFHSDRFRRVHEQMAHFYRGEWSTIYRDVPVTMDATAKAVRRKERPTHMGKIEGGSYVSFDGGPRLERSVIWARSMHGSAVHPTQKPVDLVSLLVQYCCPVGGLVVDPFMGSGTTLIASKRLGMRCIGVEKLEQNCEIAAERLRQEVLDFGPAAEPQPEQQSLLEVA